MTVGPEPSAAPEEENVGGEAAPPVTGSSRSTSHTVAALLNAAGSGVSFEDSPAQVIAAFNNVFPGTTGQYETLKNRFPRLNQRLCPLN